MIDFKVVKTSDEVEFEDQMEALLNEGYGVSYYGTGVSGSTYSPVYFIAYLSKEL